MTRVYMLNLTRCSNFWSGVLLYQIYYLKNMLKITRKITTQLQTQSTSPLSITIPISHPHMSQSTIKMYQNAYMHSNAHISPSGPSEWLVHATTSWTHSHALSTAPGLQHITPKCEAIIPNIPTTPHSIITHIYLPGTWKGWKALVTPPLHYFISSMYPMTFFFPFISFKASLIQDNTSKVANERSFMIILSIGLEVWEVPIWTNIPESVGMEIKWVWAWS